MVGSLAAGLAGTSGIFDISEITQCFDSDRLSSIPKQIKGKSRDLQKIPMYFNGTTTFVSNLLVLAGVFPVIFILYSNNLLVVVLLLLTLLLAASSLAASFSSSVK